MMESEFELEPGKRVHLIGIGGSGMSAIAHVLLDGAYAVSGSDLQENERVEQLRARGAMVFTGHHAQQVVGADVVVISSAIPATNREIAAAREAGIPVLKRAEFLGLLMAGQTGIAVAGTHGKTTTTAMIAQILIESGRDPSVILGGELAALDGNGRAGSGAYFVIEADEYDHMFLGLRPEIGVITNIEHDHPDIFPTFVAYLDAFCQFAGLLPPHGRLVVCGEEAGIVAMLEEVNTPGSKLVTYGMHGMETNGKAFDFAAANIQANQLGGSDFVLLEGDQSAGLVRLRVPGRHNVLNALASIAVARNLDIPLGQICRSLALFGGVRRRFEVVGEKRGVTIIDDYAHHPTEIHATLAAARQRYGDRRLWAVWQPHTYSRTRLLLPEFTASFAEADRVIILDVYRSREADAQGVDVSDIASHMAHPYARYVGRKEDAAAYILDRVRPGDVVITLGAGDGNLVGQQIWDALQIRVETVGS